MMKNRPFLFAAMFMLPAVFFMLKMRETIKEADFDLKVFQKSPVAEAEFLTTGEEIKVFYRWENSDLRKKNTDSMREAHHWDNWFLIFYGLFLATFAWLAFRLSQQKKLLFAAWLAAFVSLADWRENGAILQIIKELETNADFSASLARLEIWTWLKWLGLGAFYFLLIPFFKNAPKFGRPKWLALPMLAICSATFAVSLLAFFLKNLTAEFWMTQAILLAFAGLFLFAALFKKG